MRPFALGAIRASSFWPGCKLRKVRHADGFHMHEHVLAARFVGPLDETIAANAVEPFDLHRLERAGGIRKRLAVRAFAHWHGRARLLRQGCGRIDRDDLLGLEPTLKPYGHTFDDRPFGHASATVLAQHAEVQQHVAFDLLADEEAEAARRIEPFYAAGDRLHLGRTRAVVRLHCGAIASFSKLRSSTRHHNGPH